MNFNELVGPAVTAAIVGTVFGTQLSKGHKVSEFRQAWIDELRKDLAAVISHAHAFRTLNTAPFPQDLEHWRTLREDMVELNAAASRARLRINPGEPAGIRVLDCLRKVDRYLTKEVPADALVLELLVDELITAAHALLKAEWLRVKRGELLHRAIRLISPAAIIFVVTTTLFHAAFAAAARVGAPSLLMITIA